MRKTLRIFLWMIKGVLLLIALAALVMWPVSAGRELTISAQRFSARSDVGEHIWHEGSCWNGFGVIAYGSRRASHGGVLTWIRDEVRSGGESLRWERRLGENTWYRDRLSSGFWPLRWGSLTWDDSKEVGGYRYFAAPLWLVAFVTGVWPITAIAFALRRRAARQDEVTQTSWLLAAIAASFFAGAAWIRTAIKTYSRLRPDVIADQTSDSIATLGLFAIIFTLTAFLLFQHRRRLIRRALGLCQSCGYDLRATPDPSGGLLAVCPECGTKTPAGDTPGPRSIR